MDLLDGDVEITEFEALDVQQVKGVGKGANGFPHLIMKGLAAKGDRDCPSCKASFDADHKGNNCPECGAKLPAGDGDSDGAGKSAREIAVKAVTDGQIDEGPDIALGQQIMKLLAQAIQNEAAEIEAGKYDEVLDVRQLCRAADMVAAWTGREQGGCGCCADCTGLGCGCCPMCSVDLVMCSVAEDAAVKALYEDLVAKAKLSSKEMNDLPDSAFAYIEPGGEKDSEGKTTPRSKRHFAIHDKSHADNAAARIAQGAQFGDKAKAKVEAAQKKFGESDTSKAAVAEGETGVQTDAQDTGGLSKAVEDALTKALGPTKDLLKEIGDRLAKVEAAPVPGGPMMSTVRATRTEGGANWAAKAAEFRQLAEQVTDPKTADLYRQAAREAEEHLSKD